MKQFRLLLFWSLLAPVLFQGALAQDHEHQYGTTNFDMSCTADTRQTFETGLALLHHMMYEQAEAEFTAAAQMDPNCAMAHWGIAMSVIHPLWGERPTDDALEKGTAAIDRAKALAPPTDREMGYITAVETFFRDWKNTPYPAQLAAFEDGFQQLHENFPEDIDAAAFYALGHLATAPKADKTLSHQKTAGALLEELHAKAPEHPGLFHYIIHAYDNPVLAERAVAVARRYDQIAPEVPHALHMPSHIFVRLGLWQDVVEWNERSAAAALRHPFGDAVSVHYPHALDYLVYANLQQGQDTQAGNIIKRLYAVDTFQPSLASAYAMAAIPARYALERGAWAEAAAIPIRWHESFAWNQYPAAESITYFTRGIGAVRSGNAVEAREAVEMLDKLHAGLLQSGEDYWAVLTDAQRKTIAAWLALHDGAREQAVALMREAADLEDSVDKHPVTPGAVLPARELLGDMLLQVDKPREALDAYEASLRVSPNRLNSLFGAGLAAERQKDRETAHRYYTRLVENVSEDQVDRPAITHARQTLEQN